MILPWQGDGGYVVFELGDTFDEMVLMAERLRHLLVYFNGARGLLNQVHGDIHLRLVCHAGELIGSPDRPGNVSGTPLDVLAKQGKAVGAPDHVVISEAVHTRLSAALQSRCSAYCRHKTFGQTHIVDGERSYVPIQRNNLVSDELQSWISATVQQQRFKELLYFGYTLERLNDFLGKLSSVDEIRILMRNWLLEKDEEDTFNEKRQPTPEWRPWVKSPVIRGMAAKFDDLARCGRRLDVRFYDGSPTFAGAILISDRPEDAMAHVGLYKWVNNSETGGSPYKLGIWSGLCLQGTDELHAGTIECLRGRFEEAWSRSLTYQQVAEEERRREAAEPAMVGRIWALDGRRYLIVYPNRMVAGRAFPLVAHEDLMAVRCTEAFLARYNAKIELLGINVAAEASADWNPPAALPEIEKWDGHIIYVCTKVLPRSIQQELGSRGCPFEFDGIGTAKPWILNRDTGHRYESPLDAPSPEPKDYSLIAKFGGSEAGRFRYVLAGIRAIGTWGAASFLTDPKSLRGLAAVVGEQAFAAMIQVKFDPERHDLVSWKVVLPPASLEPE